MNKQLMLDALRLMGITEPETIRAVIITPQGVTVEYYATEDGKFFYDAESDAAATYTSTVEVTSS